MVSDEVQRQVALENSEAAANAQQKDIDPASSGIARMLSDNQPHVFVAGSDLDLVDAAGQECAISQGDIIEVASPPPADATTATALILAKGGKECAKSDNVNVAFTDLQDMQNHMRETIDAGMGDLQAKQGKGGLPAARRLLKSLRSQLPSPPPHHHPTPTLQLKSPNRPRPRIKPSRKWPAPHHLLDRQIKTRRLPSHLRLPLRQPLLLAKPSIRSLQVWALPRAS